MRKEMQTLQAYHLIDSQKEGDLQGLLITVRKAWQYSPGDSQQLQDRRSCDSY